MPDILKAMAISGGILLAVVALIIFVSIAAVKRGEQQMHDSQKPAGNRGRH
jgi:hypothetical protein